MTARRAQPWRCALLAALVALGSSCSQREPTTKYVYDPYEGLAFPNRRAPIAWPQGNFALVPSSVSDRITLVDLDAGTIVATSPVGRNPVVDDGPHQVVADLRANVAFVALAYPNAVSTGTHSHGTGRAPGFLQLVSLDDFRALGEVRLDPNPGELAVAEDGRRVVVSHYDLGAALVPDTSLDEKRAALALIDPTSIAPAGSPQPERLLTCVAPHGIALTRPSGDRAFVACYGEDALAVVDLAANDAPIVRVTVGANPGPPGAPIYGPYGVSLSPDGARVAIGMRESKEVRFFDVAGASMDALAVPARGSVYVTAWSADGARVYVPTQLEDAIAVYDSRSGAPLASRHFTAPECVAPLDATFVPDHGALVLVCEGNEATTGALLVLDPETLATRVRVEVGSFPGRPFVGRR